MKLKVVVHRAEEGSYWAEVPAILGCMTQGETIENLLANVREAVVGCLLVDFRECLMSKHGRRVHGPVSRRE